MLSNSHGTKAPRILRKGPVPPAPFTRTSPRRGRLSTPLSSRRSVAARPRLQPSSMPRASAACRPLAPAQHLAHKRAHGRRVVDRAQYVLQPREALQRFPRALALVEPGEEIRRVAELLDRDAQPVQLRRRQARELAPALAHPVIALLEHRARELAHRRSEARAPRFVESCPTTAAAVSQAASVSTSRW